jgi:hypothetical protein
MNFGGFFFWFRGSLGHIMAKRGKYTGSGYSIDVKETLAAIGYGLREEGWTVPAVHDLYKSWFLSWGRDAARLDSSSRERRAHHISCEASGGGEKVG